MPIKIEKRSTYTKSIVYLSGVSEELKEELEKENEDYFEKRCFEFGDICDSESDQVFDMSIKDREKRKRLKKELKKLVKFCEKNCIYDEIVIN